MSPSKIWWLDWVKEYTTYSITNVTYPTATFLRFWDQEEDLPHRYASLSGKKQKRDHRKTAKHKNVFDAHAISMECASALGMYFMYASNPSENESHREEVCDKNRLMFACGF